ncbi:MAG: flagellar motor stator protein MotA, partial [Pseudomonadota bacterium]
LPFISIFLVLICVVGSYIGLGGKLSVLYQPFEVVIILGAGLSAYMIANRPRSIKVALRLLKGVFKGPKYKKDIYEDLLKLQFQIFRLIRQRGALALEQHIENPAESTIFSNFPKITAYPILMNFICDYLRIISLGVDDPHVIETLMEEDIEALEAEEVSALQALSTLADSFPALGIVAAVLGVIKTMGSITEPPEILGSLIAGALVGTFLGVLLSYGWFSPLANGAKQVFDTDKRAFTAIKAGIIANLHGQAPSVAIEFSRKTLLPEHRPTFDELEESLNETPATEN